MINFDDDDDDTTEEDLEKFDKALSKLSNKRDKEVSAVIIFYQLYTIRFGLVKKREY